MSQSTAPAVPFDLRSEFPIKEQYAFLNHASVAPIPASTQAAISQFAQVAAEEGPANYAGWIHGMTLAREAAGRMICAEPDDICFVKSTNHGLLIVANSINWKAGDNIVGLEHEFPANILPWKNLSRLGVELRLVPERPDYTYTLDDIMSRIDERTRLVAVSWVEYATGFRNDIEALARLCRERNILFSVDAIQGLGVLPINVTELGIDFFMADGHKWMLGPEGCGILYVRRDRIAEMNNSMCGWCGQKNPQDYDNTEQPYKPTARRFEEGSHNLMSIIALGASTRLLLDAGPAYVENRVRDLSTLILRRVREKGYTVITPEPWEQRAGIVAFTKEGLGDGLGLAAQLQKEHKVMIACRRGFLRASPHFYNDEDEVERLIRALP